MMGAGCVGSPETLDQQYTSRRGIAALGKTDTLDISVPSGQPCKTFGIHASLKTVHDLYQSGEAAIIANMGVPINPKTKTYLVLKRSRW
jgi:uncharacterized protein (DUF1501 family)